MERLKKARKPKISDEFKQLDDSKNLYMQMFQHSLLPIILHDMDMNIIDVNLKATEEFLYSKEEFMKISIFDLHTESELEHSKEVLEKMKKENKLSAETYFKRKDGSVFAAEVTPCKYIVNGKPMIHVYIQNIEDRKEYEKKLLDAMKKAEESDRLKSEFLANMSHEIRTPLNAIYGFSEFLLEDGNTINNVKDYAKVIHNSSEHLLMVINDIIDISIIESGNLTITKTHFSLNELLNSVNHFISRYVNMLEKANLTIKIKIPKTDTHIISDKTRLRQILINLITNAVKFTEEGSVEFGYSIENKELKFYVKDTGIGIPEEKKNIIFKRFEKAADSSEKLFRGTGLGLSISQACVNLLGGEIWFESKVNKGTTFYFTIDQKQEEAKQKTPAKEKPEEDILFKNELVLIADDDDYNYKLLNKILTKHNLTTIHATNGKEAIKLAKDHKDISLVLMDIRMPDISGIEATKEIKKQKPKLPIIAQTAYVYQKDIENIMDAGFDGYVSKPIKIKTLFSEIRNNINKNRIDFRKS